MVRVVIADDHDLFREGLANLLTSVEDIDVVGQASTGQQVIDLIAKQQTDVVLMDLRMPELNGIDAMRFISKHYPSVAIVALTMYDDDQSAIEAIQAGACGYLLKTTSADEVIRAVQLAAMGGSTIDPSLGPRLMREYQRLLNNTAHVDQYGLTDRELTLLNLLALGRNNRQIAREMELAESTVKNNLSALFQRIGVRDRTQAVLFAFQHGIVSPTSKVSGNHP